jgi:hypothetical protein
MMQQRRTFADRQSRFAGVVRDELIVVGARLRFFCYPQRRLARLKTVKLFQTCTGGTTFDVGGPRDGATSWS